MPQLPPTILSKQISEVDWQTGKSGRTRIINALYDIHTVGDLLQHDFKYLRETPNLGKKSLEVIILTLSKLGIQIEGQCLPRNQSPDAPSNRRGLRHQHDRQSR
jgi:hypothetical protein